MLTAAMAVGAPVAAGAGEAHGGGGGGHFSGGGGGHFSGGGGAHFSGGAGGARFAAGGSGARFVGGGGHTVIGAHAGFSGFSGVRPNFGGAVAHGYSGPASRTAHFAASANHVYGGFAGGGHFVARPTGSTGVRPGLIRPGYVGGHRPAFASGSGRFWGGGYWGGRFWPGCHYHAGFAWFLPVLPFGYATYYWGNVPYYYYDGGYYSWNPDYNGYVATDPPPVADTATSSSGTDEAPPSDDGQAQSDTQSYDVQPQTYVPPPTNPNTVVTNPPPATPVVSTAAPRAKGSGVADIFVYPRNGQTEQQTSDDKTQCHNWSVAQTGFDPTRSINLQGTVADYRRAVGACLDARGYTVK